MNLNGNSKWLLLGVFRPGKHEIIVTFPLFITRPRYLVLVGIGTKPYLFSYFFSLPLNTNQQKNDFRKRAVIQV